MAFDYCRSIWGCRPPQKRPKAYKEVYNDNCDGHVPTPDDWEIGGRGDDSDQLED